MGQKMKILYIIYTIWKSLENFLNVKEEKLFIVAIGFVAFHSIYGVSAKRAENRINVRMSI